MFGTNVFRIRCFFVLGGGGQLCYRLCYRRLGPQDQTMRQVRLTPQINDLLLDGETWINDAHKGVARSAYF